MSLLFFLIGVIVGIMVTGAALAALGESVRRRERGRGK